MSIKDFSETKFCKTFDDGEIVKMGSLKVNESGELSYLYAGLYIKGNLSGNEQIRLKIYTDSDYSNLLYTSDYSNLSGITDENGDLAIGNWLGLVRVDFNKENINKELKYYVTAELNNYSRNGNDFYISTYYDFPDPIYDNSENLFVNHPMAMGEVLYRE